MQSPNQVKKNKEEACLEQALRDSMQFKGYPRYICSLLSLPDVRRKNTERPDFVKFAKNKNLIIGIEHFRVDHASAKSVQSKKEQEKNKPEKIESLHAKNDTRIKKFFDEHSETVFDTNDTSYNLLFEIMNGPIKDGQIVHNAMTYPTCLETLKHHTNNHLLNVPAYKDHLKQIAPDAKIEIVFLIEIHTDFSRLFLNNPKGLFRNDSGLMPMFADVVKTLENINPKDVQHIILQLNSTQNPDASQTIALRTGNIRKQLRNQGITMYEYAGEDLLLEPFETFQKNITTTSTIVQNNDAYDINIKQSSQQLDPYTKLHFVYSAAQMADYYTNNEISHAASYDVQYLIAGYGKNITRWERSRTNPWKVRPVVTNTTEREVLEKLNAFETKWN